jgi:light-regulated signal transduction histidine kinase (bacteriophytochrome)
VSHPGSRPVIRLAATRNAAHWTRDNAISFEQKYADEIFVLSRGFTDDHTGTRMGLTLAGRIVERQGGRIWAESELGGGSTLYFTAPALEP